MKNVIYQIDTYYNSNLSALNQFNYNNMLTYGSYSVRKYAKKIGCDYELIRPEIKESPWLTAMLEKTNLFDRFLNSNYDFFSFFDLDIKIDKDAINIFELINEEELGIHIIQDSWAEKQKNTIEEMTGTRILNYLSAGVFSCGKITALKIKKYIKNKKLEELRKNDERFLSYVVYLEKIPVSNLKKIHRQFPNKSDFLHYPQDLKEFMHVEEEMQSYPHLFRDKKYYENKNNENKDLIKKNKRIY